MRSDIQPGSFRAWSEEVHPDSRADFEDDERDTRDTDPTEPPFGCEWCGDQVDAIVTIEDEDPSVGFRATLDVCLKCSEELRRRMR